VLSIRCRLAEDAFMNTRTLVSLPDDDRCWLGAQASARGRRMTRLVRDAVAEYRVRSGSRRPAS
jgi:hypothetical protein